MTSGANPTPQQAPLPARVEPRVVDVPTSLTDKVQIETATAPDGNTYRRLVIPNELRQAANVLTPVDEIVQADPNYTPSVRLLRLDVTRHAYKQTAKKDGWGDNAKWVEQYALSKVGIHEIAKLAGIEVVESGTIPSGEPGVIKGRATIRVRRSDGTWITRTDEGVIREDIELEEIDERERAYNDSAKPDKKRSGAILDGHIRSKQREARRHFHAKATTKAILRAMRGILSLPHVYSDDDIKKPFVVIGYSFTPDTNDPAIRQAILDREFAVYGRPALPDTTPEPLAMLEPAPEGEYRAIEGEITDDEDDGFSFPPAASEPGGEQLDASAFVVSWGRSEFTGRTIGDIHVEGGEKGLAYLRYLAGLEKTPDGRTFQANTPEKHAGREAAQAFLGALETAA